MVAFNNRTRGRFVAFFNVTRDKLARYTPFSVFFELDKKRTIDRDYLKAKVFGKKVRREMNINERKGVVSVGLGVPNGNEATRTGGRRMSIAKVETGDSNV
jgi:hypothetical protein